MSMTLCVRAIVLILALGFSTSATPAGAAPIAVVNPGFEDDVLADGEFLLSFMSGWDRDLVGAGNAGPWNPTASEHPLEAPEGLNVAFSSAGSPTISQILGDVLAIGSYTLQIEVGRRLDLDFSGYDIELLAGGVVLAADNSGLTPDPGDFETSTVVYTALAGDPNLGELLEIRMRRAGGPAVGPQTNFDDVRLDYVPEPSTGLLMALGLFGLGARRRTR